MQTTLTPTERAIIKRIAAARRLSNRRNGVANGRIGPQDDDTTDLEGIAAEMAFCKLCNLYPDLNVSPRSGGHDCVGKNGARIDVKATTYDSGQLLACISKDITDADVYVLMVGRFPGPYRLAGWATADELLAVDNVTDLGHGPTYAMPQEKLRRVK